MRAQQRAHQHTQQATHYTLVLAPTDTLHASSPQTPFHPRSMYQTGDLQGEGTILGSVIVVSNDGEVLLHHKEKVWGDHPDEDDLKAAIDKLN